MFAAFAALAVLSTAAYAQIPALNISQGCESTLAAIATSPDNSCLNAAGLVASIGSANANSSLVGPLGTWAQGMCSQQACTNQTLANLVNNITSGCSSDLASLGFTSDVTPSVVASVQEFFPSFREIVCLKNSTSGNLCFADALNTVQNKVGTLSENNLPKVIGNLMSGTGVNDLLNSGLICSDCGKAVVNVLSKDQIFTSDDTSSLQSMCGSNFTDGQTPSSVSQTAAGLSSNNGNSSSAAFPAFPLSSVAFSLGGLASAFALLA